MLVFGQALKLRGMTTSPLPPHHPHKRQGGVRFSGDYPNFTITKEVGLWARAHLKNEVWIDTRGRPWIVTDNQVRHQYR